MKKIRNLAITLIAFAAALSLYSCSSDDEPQVATINRVELVVKANFSQDFLSVMTPSIKTSLNESGHMSSQQKTLTKTENSFTISASSFPATISAPITIAIKNPIEALSGSRTFSYDIEYRLIAYKSDGSNEVINATDGLGGTSSITIHDNVTKDECEYYAQIFKQEIENKCNAIFKNISTKNGKITIDK